MKFSELNLDPKIKKGLDSIGFEEMMPIQEETIPLIMNGNNIIGEAETGTGKTAAFVIPLLNNIDFKSNQTECLIVTPTRELAMQIVGEIKKIGKYMNISLCTVVGGMGMREQIQELKSNPTIVVGTLGRINDHLRSKRLKLNNVKYFVLDEADEMLKEGFKEDITSINEQIPTNKQTLLFSATISKQILSLTKTIMDDYSFVSVKNKEKLTNNIEQYYIVMKEKQKFSTLTKLLDVDNPKSTIIFGRTKKRVDELTEALNKCGYKALGIHGDLSQQQRNSVMSRFRENKISILVATDVAARGLDISDISHVYNFDLPQEVEFYVHRIGRTGRARKHGISYSFIRETEIDHIRRIEKETNFKINEKSIPDFSEVWDVRNQYVKDLIKEKLSLIDTTKTKVFANELVDEFGAQKLASILIETFSKKTDIQDVALTGEPPVVMRKQSKGNTRKDKRDREKNIRPNSRSNTRSNGTNNKSPRRKRKKTLDI